MTVRVSTEPDGGLAMGRGPTAAVSDDAVLARILAEAAGAILLGVRRTGTGLDPATLRDAGDAAAQHLLAEHLAAQRPDDAVLSEEAVDDRRRLGAERVWIIDRLDGTREFAEGRSDWAVHVALWERGDLVAGAVALPALGLVLTTEPAPAVPAFGAGRPRLAISRSRPPASAAALAERLGWDLVPMGSAGYKAAAVVRGEADAYVHAGGQYEWDSAAPAAVALAAGLHASRLDGSPLRYNQPDVSLPDLVICRPELAEPVLATMSRLTREDG